MDKKLFRVTRRIDRLNFIALVVFAAVSFFFSPLVGAIELLAVILLFVYSRIMSKRRSREVARYVENLMLHVDSASKNSVMNFPLPTSVIDASNATLMWCNEAFCSISGASSSFFDVPISDIIPGMDISWALAGQTQSPSFVTVNKRKYNVYCSMVRPGNSDSLLMILYWVDATELYALRTAYDNSRPVTAIIMIDNYEELLSSSSEAENSAMLAAVDKVISSWAGPTGGILRKYDRAKYLMVFEERYLRKMIENKFKLLDSVKEIQSSNGISATLSLGIGRDAPSFNDGFAFANLALDMALSRGGDQAVVKSRNNFEFFGGRTLGVEKNTKVRSRVLANALGQLILDSSVILVMGHKMSDIDCIGAASGIVCIARKYNRKVHILADAEQSTAKDLIARMNALPEYDGVFIGPEEGARLCDSKCLLVIVDTNRPEVVEYPQLLSMAQRIAVIDHHRRAVSYIDNCAINMHEPYASSASELVSELMQYIVSPKDVMRQEAEALFAGIYLDTKGFVMKSGVRTFEAAAYLKRLGADTVEVRRMFSSDMKSYSIKNRIVENARVVYDCIAVSEADYEVSRAIAGQAADELLEITGIQGSVVLFGCAGGIFVSARSFGKINVQVIMEKMGGGGSLTNAGAQLHTTMSEAVEMLEKAIGEYIEQNGALSK